eukprot:gene36999-45639_t
MDILKSVTAAGTAAVITVTGIHPIDVVKTRLQVSGKNGARNYKALGISGTIGVILKEEGAGAFWKGIGAAWLREASYTSLRLGLYAPIKDLMGVKKDSNFLLKFTAGSLAGAIGSTAGNPFDVLKTRMMATEGLKTPALGDAARELYKAQGMGGFYRGLQANVARAMVLNGTKMGLPTQFTYAFCAGFFMACTVSPFDMIRTTFVTAVFFVLMNQPPDAKIYNEFVDCAAKIIKESGPMGLYAGFIPIWARFAPTT